MQSGSTNLFYTSWNLDPTILFAIVLLHGSYLLLVGPLRIHFPHSRPVTTGQLTAFTCGILTLFVALVSPLDYFANYYWFSAHMLQHILLTLVAPPLLLLGLPGWLFDPLEDHAALLRLARFLTNPYVAFFSFNVVFALWHLPSLYQLALEDPIVHIFEHATLFATAILTWMPMLSPTLLLPRLSLPAQVLYLFLQSFMPTGLGALITFDKEPLYSFYAQAPRLLNVNVIEDQVYAGLIMWLGGSLILLLALTFIFFKWFGREGPIEGQGLV